ncbi:hypoxanthine-guanine phosphoribosyltransferase HprT [Acetobacterium woodii DSM 1030]|uniref:Hypoxanthine phosphoribosyltransferase n=1 Tax=Acetobacterium woodii (strain ATCC 29683 / DSM 1030 / JCM 2381 / KCTC 1655 / WB1) TaxID=931626 RepID=H6LI17_ACEWD|nr:hypoxanthine-guanine phosphoribosyltransferase HprT [Acetobacterium woodii DSM 1030]
MDEQALDKRVSELGERITADYRGKYPVMIGILKGSSVFMADLIRRIPIPMEIDFLKASSYGAEAQSSGNIKLESDLSIDVKDRSILLVEDIVDTGNTLKFLLNRFESMGAKEVKVCSLLDKPDRREQRIVADYIGFEIPNEFVVGYGLDYDQKYRNLPFIGILKREIYE